MTDVFISYSREDRPRIEKLAAALEAEGFDVWWDKNLSAGAHFSKETEARLNEAKVVLVAWSNASVYSMWVADEATVGRDKGVLVPVAIDDVSPPIGFRQIQTMAFEHWNDDPSAAQFGELCNVIRARLGGENANRSARAPEAAAPSASPPARGIVKPGIAVLPFVNMSSDDEVEFLADGLTEDIITLLSTNRHLAVAARTSVYAYKGKSPDVRDIGSALGARYVVEGSVRKMGARARITAQFINAETGDHIWANKFDVLLDVLHESSDEIVEQISGNIFAQLIGAEADRSATAPLETLSAWEHCQRAARAIGAASGSSAGMHQIMSELKAALEREPEYALAHAILAWGCIAVVINGIYTDDAQRAVMIDAGKMHLARARELARDDLLAHVYIGAAENYRGSHEQSVHTLERVLARMPALPEAWFMISMPYAYLGRFDDARKAIERASALAPEGGYARQREWYRGNIAYLAGDYETGLRVCARHVLNDPGYGYANVIAALCAAGTGDDARAAEFVRRAKAHNPHLTPQRLGGMICSQFDKEKGVREFAMLQSLWSAAGPA